MFPTNSYTHEEQVHVGEDERSKLAPIDSAGAPQAEKRAAIYQLVIYDF